MTVALTVSDLACATCGQTVMQARQGLETAVPVTSERKTQPVSIATTVLQTAIKAAIATVSLRRPAWPHNYSSCKA